MYVRRNKVKLGFSTVAAGLGLMAFSACGTGEDAAGDCVSNEQFFQEEVYVTTLATKCASCHNSNGAAKDTSFILRGSEWGPDYLEQNLKVFEQMAKLEYDGRPWILAKPTNEIEHGGAVQFETGSEEYEAFAEMVNRVNDPVVCDDVDPAEEFFDGVVLLDEVATLRKASLALVGRLPTLEEEQRVRDESFEGLDAVLDQMMTEQAFLDRIIEIYNDSFLTDRYYPGTEALNLLSGLEGTDEQAVYPDVFWFDEITDEEERNAAEAFSNRGVARESLQLVAHVIRNDLPYTEILTADYTMVNPFSARSYGVSPSFATGDYNEFVSAQIPGIPHAGVLTNTVFMMRFPTTATNRNRHRARKVFEFFLATDVLRLGERAIDATPDIVNPTANDPNCTVCHQVIDPIAGTLQNWTEMGYYTPPVEGWYPEMVPAGFGDAVMPPTEVNRATQWLAEQLIADPRFAIAPIHMLFTGLSGQEPLREPSDPTSETYLQSIRAFDVQAGIFQEIANQFVEDNYNIKTVVKEIIKSPYYRAANAGELTPEREAELADVGTGRLLTPEQLHRKIEAMTGQPWRNNGNDLLLEFDEYRIFYGGIDSNDVTERITDPNGIMANVASRMGNEMACWTVAGDFAKDPSDRKMFPFVELGFEPEDENGFEVSGASSAIRANIQYLHQRLLGEFVELRSPEVDATYDLFLQVWKDGQAFTGLPIEEGGYPTALPGACQATADFWTGMPLPEERQITDDPSYTIRAWMAVTSYLLSDYRFLHE